MKKYTLSMILFLVTACAWGDEKRGNIEQDQRWTLEGSPYLVTDDILIPRGVRVVISPGVKIIISKPHHLLPNIPQIDNLDSFSVSIKVKGVLSCVGKRDSRIQFIGEYSDSFHCEWYGLIIDSSVGGYTECAFTDISGSCKGLIVRSCNINIRNCTMTFNNIGITCEQNSRPSIYNSVIAHNFTAGLKLSHSNPTIHNSIFIYNKVNGIIGDNISRMTFTHNCLWENGDGNFLNCDPQLGVVVKTNKNKDSTDYQSNLLSNPIFAGSPSDSTSVEKDINLPTDKSRIKDTLLAKEFYDTLSDSLAYYKRHKKYPRFWLSHYSPCINAGKPGKKFKDEDGTVNDMGIWGGQDLP